MEKSLFHFDIHVSPELSKTSIEGWKPPFLLLPPSEVRVRPVLEFLMAALDACLLIQWYR